MEENLYKLIESMAKLKLFFKKKKLQIRGYFLTDVDLED